MIKSASFNEGHQESLHYYPFAHNFLNFEILK